MSASRAIGIQCCGQQWREAELRRDGERIVVDRLSRSERAGSDAAPPARRDGELNSQVLIASLASGDVMSRCYALPATSEARVQQMVQLRLDADLPVALDQLTWGVRPTHSATDGESARYVVVQAARTERVARQTAALSAAGREPDVLTTESEAVGALYRHGIRRNDAGNDVVVFVDSADWLVAVMAGGVARTVRRIPWNRSDVNAACRECQQSVAASAAGVARRVLWCGPRDAEIEKTLATTLGIAVERAEPEARLVGPDDQPPTAEQLAEFGPAIGLALGGLLERDALIRLAGRAKAAPQTNRWERILTQPKRCTAAAIAMLALAVLVHVGGVWWDVRTMRGMGDEAAAARSGRASLEPKARALRRLETYRVDIERIVSALCSPIPDGIVLSSLTLSRERDLTLKGTAEPPTLIYSYAEALRKSQWFREVSPGRTEPGAGGTFTLTAELAPVRKLTTRSGRSGR